MKKPGKKNDKKRQRQRLNDKKAKRHKDIKAKRQAER
jgi:hypothetical protein